MAKTLEDLLRERPGNPEAQAAHKERMLAEVRAYRLPELREMLALPDMASPHDKSTCFSSADSTPGSANGKHMNGGLHLGAVT